MAWFLSSVGLLYSLGSLVGFTWQHGKEFMFDNQEVVDFVTVSVGSVLCLPDGQAILWWNVLLLWQFKLQKYC